VAFALDQGLLKSFDTITQGKFSSAPRWRLSWLELSRPIDSAAREIVLSAQVDEMREQSIIDSPERSLCELRLSKRYGLSDAKMGF
jgi:hypothetical protein